ncbi:MAG: hypothetical protein AAF389_05355 [Gemmatimonadota bacterium]
MHIITLFLAALSMASCILLAVDEVAGPAELDDQAREYVFDNGGMWAHERTVQYELRNRGNDTVAVDTTVYGVRRYRFGAERDPTGNYEVGSRTEEDGSTQSFRWSLNFFGSRLRLDIAFELEPTPGSADESYFLEEWDNGRLVLWHQPRGSSSLEGQRHYLRRR